MTPSEHSVVSAPAQQPGAGVHNPWLTINLQENHLLSLDIASWAKAQGMHLLWNSNKDYLIYSTINLTGKDRDEVLNQLGQLFRSENYGLVVKLYEKNNVLVIDGQ
ncbi:pilus assembly protein [Salmonella enterica subsp. enterica]|nr:pilus assembly protein [Salmonella enterica]EEI1253439.1 pilus assembly protein [Salmonella enterica subsp. enterica]EEL2516789.1 pilus assembly protein [Salmonella enterica]EEO4172581.1 pilus assembly protein [Salmonella enterica subsp. enterica]EIO8741077.1 TcpQ domain-containing protein [Salmonella enterica]